MYESFKNTLRNRVHKFVSSIVISIYFDTSGLSEWFVDNVNSRGEFFYFHLNDLKKSKIGFKEKRQV
jgi:hypothetical protein